MNRKKILAILRSRFGIATQLIIILLAITWYCQTLDIEPLIVIIGAVTTLLSTLFAEKSKCSFEIMEWDLRTSKAVNFGGKPPSIMNIIAVNVIIENATSKSIVIKKYFLDATIDDMTIQFDYASTGIRKDSYSSKDEIKFIEKGQVKDIWLQFSEKQTNTVIDHKTISRITISIDTNFGRIKTISKNVE